MSFVNHYLPYFRLYLITHVLSAHLVFQALFTESLWGVQLLAPHAFSGLAAFQLSTFPGFITFFLSFFSDVLLPDFGIIVILAS
jgi:hypothetical protein